MNYAKWIRNVAEVMPKVDFGAEVVFGYYRPVVLRIEDRAYDALHNQFKLSGAWSEENWSFKAFLGRVAARHPEFPEP